jgi:hypothetical protein
MLIKQKSLNDFLRFATTQDYLAASVIAVPRLQDSRLLSLETNSI